MKDLGNWALDNRKLIYFLVAVLTIGGVFAYYDMSKLEDPEIKVKQAAVVTVYPGASAHQVELEVTDVLEKSIRSMKDIGEVTSRSMNDMSLINVSLSTLVTNEETEQCWDILRRKVADVQAELPEGASVSVVMDDFGDVFGMFYAMTFDGYTDAEAARYAELVKKEVMKIEGISKVNIYGQRPECIYIELYEDKLANLGVHPAEVLATLNGQNKTVYSGYYESGGSRLRVTVNDRYRTTEDIGSLLLQGHEDDQLRLRDIASVTEGYENPVRNELRYDGRRALGISISALSGTDITKIGRQVERTLERLENERMPAGMEIHEVFFQPEKVEAALHAEFPTARVLRMDMDTTRRKHAHEEMLAAFSKGEADILLGTQMIVKGHDYANVTLVGILAADLSLHEQDFRSGEKTFQLLCQAAGRAGRGDKRGDVIIQTYSPEHYSITTAAEHSYENFFKEEYTYRQLMGYPPCAHMLVILVQSGDESQSVIARLRIEKMIEQSQVGQEVPVQILTPGQASLSKLKDVYRQVLYLKHKDKETLLDLKRRLEPVLEKHPMFAGITIQFDFDPLSHY